MYTMTCSPKTAPYILSPRVLTEALAAAVLEFDDIVNGPFATFMQKSGQIGGLVDQQVGVNYFLPIFF